MTLYNYIWRISYDDITFAEFDRNPNFVLDDILPHVDARLGNYGNCSSYWIDFIRDEIAHSLMQQ
jgi:hypothetical protein